MTNNIRPAVTCLFNSKHKASIFQQVPLHSLRHVCAKTVQRNSEQHDSPRLCSVALLGKRKGDFSSCGDSRVGGARSR